MPSGSALSLGIFNKKQNTMNNKFQKIKSIIVVGLSLFVICLFSFLSDIDGYYTFYKKDKPLIIKKLDAFSQSLPINFIGKYTGAETGYGFFGPNVSSDFIFEISIYDENGNIKNTLNRIPIKSKEGALRLGCINNMFIDKLDDIDEKHNRYLDIILEQITKRIKKDYPKNYRVEMKMYLYEYPSIIQFNKGNNIAKKVLIKDYII